MRLNLTTLQSASEAVTTVHVTEVSRPRTRLTSSWHADEVAANDGECRGRCYSEVRFLSKHSDSGIDERSFNDASLPNTTR
jgi:hypothetical protein